jgi:hypothetical protein
MGSRCCSQCGRNTDISEYSNNQWRKGVGISRCSSCVSGNSHGGGRNNPSNDSNRPSTARINDSSGAEFTQHALDYPFAQGAFRWVAKGEFTVGRRAGEPAVTKWFKDGHRFSEEFFSKDIQAVEKTIDLVYFLKKSDL